MNLQGIDVKMITGDHLLIGKETAKLLGMGTEMYRSETLIKVRLATARNLALEGSPKWSQRDAGYGGSTCTMYRSEGWDVPPMDHFSVADVCRTS